MPQCKRTDRHADNLGYRFRLDAGNISSAMRGVFLVRRLGEDAIAIGALPARFPWRLRASRRNFAPATPRLPMPLNLMMVAATSGGLLLSCAAEGRPSGGPTDIDGPRVVKVEPPSGTRDLLPEQSIAITFHELVDPLSITGALEFTPQIPFSARVRGRRIIVRPDEPYQPDKVYTLTLQRDIRDFRRNAIPQSYQFVFSSGSEIPPGLIRGRVAEIDPQRPMEMGLFRKGAYLPATRDNAAARGIAGGPASAADPGGRRFALVQRVGLAADGSFSFAYLPDGTYRLAAVEDGLGDFPAGIYHRPYALPSTDSLVVSGDTLAVALRRSMPLAKPQIRSAEWVTDRYLHLTFDPAFGHVPPPTNIYPIGEPTIYGYVAPDLEEGDTLVIDLGGALTSLGEPYRLFPFAIPVSQVVDTLPPALAAPGRAIRLEPSPTGGAGPVGSGRGRIRFSEPVRLPSGLAVQVFGPDSLPGDTLYLPLRRESPLVAAFDVPRPEYYRNAVIATRDITDTAGNPMTDSLLLLDFEFTTPPATGSILGTISGLEAFDGQVAVEVRDAKTGRRVAYTVTESKRYRIDHIPPGFYTLFGHEEMGAFPVPYYSGRWEPYRRSGRFGLHPQPVEVRPRWDVEGIDINFDVHTFVVAAPDRPVGKD